MTKIGILTLPMRGHGGALQGLALYNFLRQNSYEPYFINREYISKQRFLTHAFLANLPFFNIKNYKYAREIMSDFNSELRNFYQNETEIFFSLEQLKKNIPQYNFEAIVVGSDQVWRPEYTGQAALNYFLDFVSTERILKVAYAASFGVGEWRHSEMTPKIAELLNDFTAISVREDSGVELCKKHFNISSAVQVLDPTFLVDLSFYTTISSFYREKDRGEKTLFSYILDFDSNKANIIQKVSKQLNLINTPIHLENDINKYKKIKVYKYPTISEWLFKIRNSEFVLTDSFHGTVFAIIFNKPFISIVNHRRGADRFTSLLSQLHLIDRLVHDGDEDTIDYLLTKTINYTAVNEILETKRAFSKAFLLNNLPK